MHCISTCDVCHTAPVRHRHTWSQSATPIVRTVTLGPCIRWPSVWSYYLWDLSHLVPVLGGHLSDPTTYESSHTWFLYSVAICLILLPVRPATLGPCIRWPPVWCSYLWDLPRCPLSEQRSSKISVVGRNSHILSVNLNKENSTYSMDDGLWGRFNRQTMYFLIFLFYYWPV